MHLWRWELSHRQEAGRRTGKREQFRGELASFGRWWGGDSCTLRALPRTKEQLNKVQIRSRIRDGQMGLWTAMTVFIFSGKEVPGSSAKNVKGKRALDLWRDRQT